MLFGHMLLLNSPGGTSEAEAKGTGYDLAVDDLLPSELFALRDTWRLNDARLATMRSHAIENQRITRLHEAGRRFLARRRRGVAARGAGGTTWPRSAPGLGVTLRAYPQVMGTLNDVIKGIVFFLALVVPTAFFGERLLFAAADIRWQIGGFAVLLLIVWTLISQVHPAFDIAHPLIILLAFFMMAMATFVLGMLSTRFNRFLKEYPGREGEGARDRHQPGQRRLRRLHARHLQHAQAPAAHRPDPGDPDLAHLHGPLLHLRPAGQSRTSSSPFATRGPTRGP